MTTILVNLPRGCRGVEGSGRADPGGTPEASITPPAQWVEG